MKVCAAQFRPVAGDFDSNIARHIELIQLAVEQGAHLVFFPELSITGYEPRLAKLLACDPLDDRLNILQSYSDKYRLLIGVGLPINITSGVQIGMVWFSPCEPRLTYAKQQLHTDENPYFVAGIEQLILNSGRYKLAPAICYESLLMKHADSAAAQQADVYLASVAKSNSSMSKAVEHYPSIANKHGMYVIMANCVGVCDDFVSVGQSGVWSFSGKLLASLDSESVGIVILDIEHGVASVHKLPDR
ncbi:carbon-nitrogen hydrolase family protein [Vibrio cholerae]